MVKNNIKAICIFILVKYISNFAFVTIGNNTSRKWRVEKFNNFMVFEQNKGIILTIVSIVLCGIIARLVLKDQESIRKNMFSVSILAIILLFCNLTNNIFYLNSNYVLIGAFAQLEHFKYSNLLELSIIFLPSLIMGLSIKRKKCQIGLFSK